MTYAQLLQDVRENKLVEVTEDFYSDGNLLGLLDDAALEIASMMEFPRARAALELERGENEISLPGDMVRPTGSGVAWSGWPLRRTSFDDVMLKRLLPKGVPRVYYVDFRNPTSNLILIAPTPRNAGTVTIEYVARLSRSNPTPANAATIEPWNGRFPGFHDLVGVLGVAKAWEKGHDMERASYYRELFKERLVAFSDFLGNTALAERLQPKAVEP